jgi:L-ribulose-5-phosphate 3-epimerase
MKIGLRLESLGLPLRRALAEVTRLEVGGVQLDAVGELAPDKLSHTGRRDLSNLLKSNNVELTAIGGPMRRGLDTAENLQARIDYLRSVLALSFDLGPRIVIVQPGRFPDDDKTPGAALLNEALLALGQHGDRVGAVLALETGLESAETLVKHLERFDTGSLAVNFDPANLLMNGFDPYGAVSLLHQRIVHTHAKDGRKAGSSRAAAEVPLGQGDLDWLRLIDALNQIEYRGWLVAERETAPGDMEASVKFFRRLAS